ncbi:MAG: hypothetical protein RMM53_00415 [Bacteroidia bacterium]|nr:hypothetical protein [Bacteroidia bacterium]
MTTRTIWTTFFILGLAACGTGNEEKIKDLEAENAVLRAEIENKEKAIEDFMESFAVLDSNLTRLEEIRGEIQISKTMGAKEKISKLFDEVIRLSEENEKMSKRLQNLPIQGKAADKLKAELQRKLDESNAKIQELMRENLALKQQLIQRQKELQIKDSAIAAKEKTLAQAELEKRKLESAVREKEALNKEERARTLFAEGKNFEDLADKTSAAFKGKEKRELYQKACEKYRQAKELGHPHAQIRIMDIQEKTKNKVCAD